MQKLLFIFLATAFFCQSGFAQRITYSDVNKDDNRKMNFEILGRFGDNFLVYKNIFKKHRLAIYDNDMHISNTINLDFISDKTFNVDFVTYPDYFYIIYQYQKARVIYCMAAKLNGNGQLMGEVQELDTTKTNLFNDNKIYYLANSEDKTKILLYKMQHKNDDLSLTVKLFDASLKMLDSTRNIFDYNERRDTYDDLQVGNDGTYLFAKETGNARNDYTRQIYINYHRPNSDSLITKEILLDGKYVEDVNIKIDNLNRQYLVNSFSYRKNSGNIDGLFTVVINNDNFAVTKKAITVFNDSIRSMFTGRTDARTAFNDFSYRNIILKKDGGFILTAEDNYTQNRNNRWNSRDYFYNPYYYSPNYYSFQRGYYGSYYRDPFWYNNNGNADVTYFYNDILVTSFNKNLQPEWNAVINKKQNDVETDNFLSFSTVNMGSEIHYLFLQKDNNREVMSDHAIKGDGQIIRYPTIKGGESGYDFMPRLAKQVGARQAIVPCVFRSNIAFAKIDF